ncbi:cysteine proteinase [Lentinus tigrinus ALCF2SS1-7]|uniref:Cysteine proteinase n=1 Tax=Lentinus tigrinus ALCF2SS1-6 TaxID=1328759 RepID=A0A5C2SQD6_9APHY|nr:cysteine proteinase [Lentinus tigrinus ALCF2SS1-6]RPD79998.1 cysteine proteinase [Lentinus tigrinus ALCF2SS1-7]
MAQKKNKLKKMLSPPQPAPVDDLVDDDALMDDLLAHLDSKDHVVREESATVLKEMQIDGVAQKAEEAPKKDSKARHKARQARKAAALAESYAPTDTEADARLERQAKEEEENIKRVCEELGLILHEITPDGHCLFSAVADQLALLGIIPQSDATFATCRAAAADYIYSHMDDFLPFLPSEVGEDAAGATDPGLMTREEFYRYCKTMRNTAAWGGEPEILALSRAFNVPIHVVQGGTPPVVVHDPRGDQESKPGDKRVVYISYHRRLYGLGEHYNSLRPKTLLNSIKSALH